MRLWELEIGVDVAVGVGEDGRRGFVVHLTWMEAVD